MYWNSLLQQGLTRTDVVLTLGGGVVVIWAACRCQLYAWHCLCADTDITAGTD